MPSRKPTPETEARDDVGTWTISFAVRMGTRRRRDEEPGNDREEEDELRAAARESGEG